MQNLKENLKEDVTYITNNGFRNISEIVKILKENNNDTGKALQAFLARRKLRTERIMKKLELYEKGDFKTLEEEKAKRKQERERKANKEIGKLKRDKPKMKEKANKEIEKLKRGKPEMKEKANKEIEKLKKGKLEMKKKAKRQQERTGNLEVKVNKEFRIPNRDNSEKKDKIKIKLERMQRKSNRETKKTKLNISEKKEKRQKFGKGKLRTHLRPNLKNLILDGNNMLYAPKEIRKLMLEGEEVKAEKRLVTLALEYAKSVSIQELTIIFDVTKLSFDWSKVNKNNKFVKEGIVNETNKFIKLRVFSANPNFTNSDDALVTMSANYSKDELANMLFVTSDQELLRRLDEKGSHVMKTGVWFKLAKAKLRGQYDSILTK
jgi:hypothetical protein